jgi:protease-4
MLTVWGLLPLVLGTILSVVAVPMPKVAVIRFSGIIWPGSIPYLGEMLDAAQRDRHIRAVVLEIDSPGGDVTATEELYYRLLELRQERPLVVSIDYLAASGGYYLASAGDYAYAKPASLIGNIGVISFLPPVDEQRFTDEDYVATGPFKFSGGSRDDYVRQIELAKQAFLEAVYAQRGERLDVDRQELSSGEIYMGLQAVRMGLVDDLGANSEAVQMAADLAHLRRFEVVDLNERVHGGEPTDVMWGSAKDVAGALARRDPAWYKRLYYLYVEPAERRP